MSLMRAVFDEQFGPPEVLRLGERPIPEPGADEVLVQVAAAGVNPIDRRLRGGELQELFTREWPIIPGWGVAGRIVSTGAEVSGWKVGDDVVGLAFTWSLHHGTYAEYVPVKAVSIACKPPELGFNEAAGAPLPSSTITPRITGNTSASASRRASTPRWSR